VAVTLGATLEVSVKDQQLQAASTEQRQGCSGNFNWLYPFLSEGQSSPMTPTWAPHKGAKQDGGEERGRKKEVHVT